MKDDKGRTFTTSLSSEALDALTGGRDAKYNELFGVQVSFVEKGVLVYDVPVDVASFQLVPGEGYGFYRTFSEKGNPSATPDESELYLINVCA